MKTQFFSLPAALLVASAYSSPTPTQPDLVSDVVDLVPSTITSESQIESITAGLQSDAADYSAVGSAILAAFGAIVPTPAPASPVDALSSIASVYAAHPTDFIASGLSLVLNGLAGSDFPGLEAAEGAAENSYMNSNPKYTNTKIYPKKAPFDAPYSISEKALRAAIYIPAEFTYGNVTPVIFLPGTAAYAGSTFEPNIGKLFKGSDYADPIYLNIPGAQLNDIQINAEFIAYAINYISGISGGKNVSMLSWSAGSIGGQWAMTYWPSARKKVSNFVTMSADYHGTVLAKLLCPSFPEGSCPPAIIQQEYNSTFIRTLRNAGGASVYVPTTSIYSGFDEIVEPQQGSSASAFILDTRGVGVSNTEIQNACTVAQPAGTFYFHEGVLYNPLAFALARDALKNGGPGQLSRINVTDECQKIVSDGLSIFDLLATEAVIPMAGYYIGSYANKTETEPAIMGYAQKDVPRR